MIVIDNSALVEVLTGTPTGETVLKRIEGEDVVTSPEFLKVEVVSALMGLRKGKKITEEDIRTALQKFGTFNIRFFDTSALNDRILQLGHNLSAYDASYVALAEHLKAPLITTDRRIARGLGPNYSHCVIETF